MALVLGLSMAAGVSADTDGEAPVFNDVQKESLYYYKPVYWAAKEGIAKGYNDGSFGVGDTLTRKDMMLFLWRYSGRPECDGELPFVDCANFSKTSDTYKALVWGYKNGITRGTDSTHFSPYDPVNRKDAMIMLYRVAGKPSAEGVLSFKDCNYDEGTDTYNSILWGSSNGITKGYADGTFAPKEDCTREQVITFLYRYYLLASEEAGDDDTDDKEKYRDPDIHILKDLADDTLEVPELIVEGDKWPCDESVLQEAWEKYYRYMYVVYGPIADDFFEQGLTWRMTEETLAERVNEQYPEENLITMGIQVASEDVKQCIDGLLHETGHIWLQNNNEALQFDYGQWIWEAQTNLFERIVAAEGERECALAGYADLIEYAGWEALNGTVTDGDKAYRSFSDISGSFALYYLDTVLSTPGTYDYWQKVSVARTEYCKAHNCSETNREVLSQIMDEVANGKTIDGMKPSEWLFSRAVSNINGADGTYLTVFGNYQDSFGIDMRVTAYGFTRKNGKETGLSGNKVTFKLYDASGNMLGSETATLEDNGVIEKLNVDISGSINDYSAVRITAQTTVNGVTYTDTNYTLRTAEDDIIGATDNRMFFILINEDETINTSLTDVAVEGGYNVDTSHLKDGLLIVQAEQGESVTLFGKTYSKPAGARTIPIVAEQ